MMLAITKEVPFDQLPIAWRRGLKKKDAMIQVTLKEVLKPIKKTDPIDEIAGIWRENDVDKLYHDINVAEQSYYDAIILK